MRHLIYVIPYVAIYFIAALIVYNSDKFWQIALTVVIALFISKVIRMILPSLANKIESSCSKILGSGNCKYIDSFKLPSTVVYRVRKKYDISLNEISVAEDDIKHLFKQAHEDIKNGHLPKSVCSKVQPISYIFWNELYKTGELYNNFCKKSLGKIFTPPFSKIKEVESQLVELKPTLKN